MNLAAYSEEMGMQLETTDMWDSEKSKQYAQGLADFVNITKKPGEHRLTAEDMHEIATDPLRWKTAVEVSSAQAKLSRL